MWEAISAVAASISVIIAMVVLLVSLYRTKPRIIVRWYLDYRNLSVEFVNTGERIAERVRVKFTNLDNLRSGSEKYPRVSLADKPRVFTLLPGESYTLPLANTSSAGKLMEDKNVENSLNIKGEWNYRSWYLRRHKPDSAEWGYLQWDDYYKALIPPEPAEDRLVRSIKDLTKALKGRLR